MLMSRSFNYALATKVLLVGMVAFLILSIICFVSFAPAQVSQPLPDLPKQTSRAEVISLYRYIHDKTLPPSFEKSIWDAFFLSTTAEQKKALASAFPDKAYVLTKYAMSESKEQFFMNEGIVVLLPGGSALVPQVPSEEKR